MAKRWGSVAGTLLLMCLAPAAVMAANESMVTLTLGRQTPTGAFGNVGKSGSAAALSAGYRVTSWLAVGADAAYFRSLGVHDGENLIVNEPESSPPYKPDQITLAESWNITELGLYAKTYMYQRGRLSPYLRGGAGAYTLRWSEDVKSSSIGTTVGGNEQQSKFGVQAGGGFTFRINGGNTLGVESLVHCIFARDQKVSMWLTGVTLGFGPAVK